MGTIPVWVFEADWLATPESLRTLILPLPQEIQAFRKKNEELLAKFTISVTELASKRQRISRSSRHSSKPPSSARSHPFG